MTGYRYSFVVALLLTVGIPLESRAASFSDIANTLKPAEENMHIVSSTSDPFTALTAEERTNVHLLTDYIRFREEYRVAVLRWNYNRVRLMTEPKIYEDFVKSARPENTTGNLAKLGREGIAWVTFQSIAFSDPQHVEVNFTVHQQANETAEPTTLEKHVRVAFEYRKMNLTADERFLNPTGFRVISYELNEGSRNGTKPQ